MQHCTLVRREPFQLREGIALDQLVHACVARFAISVRISALHSAQGRCSTTFPMITGLHQHGLPSVTCAYTPGGSSGYTSCQPLRMIVMPPRSEGRKNEE